MRVLYTRTNGFSLRTRFSSFLTAAFTLAFVTLAHLASAQTHYSSGSGTWTGQAWYSNAARTILAGSQPTAASWVSIGAGHNVSYNATIAANTTISQVTIENTAGSTLTFSDAAGRTLNVTGDVTIGAAGTIISGTTSTHTFNISGNLQNNGILNLAAGAGALVNVVLNGGNATFSGTGATYTFNNLTVNSTTAGVVKTIAANFTVSGLLSVAPGTAVTNSLQFDATGTARTITALAGITLTTNGAGIANLNMATPGTATSHTINLTGTLTNNGVLNLTNGTNVCNVTFNGATGSVAGGALIGNYVFNNLSIAANTGLLATINGSATVNGNLDISPLSGTNSLRFTGGPARTLTVAGNVTVATGGTFDVAAVNGHTLNVGGNLTNNGTITFNTGNAANIVLTGASASISGAGTNTFNNLTVTANTGAVKTIATSFGAVALSVTPAGTNANTLQFDATGTARAITLTGALTVTNGTGTATFNMAAPGSATTHTITTSGAITNTGNINFTNGTNVCNVTLSGASATLSGTGTTTYNNLTVASATINAIKTIGGSFTVNGDLAVSPTAVVNSLQYQAGGTPYAVTVLGNVSVGNGTGTGNFNMAAPGTATTHSLILGGNFTVNAAGVVTLINGTNICNTTLNGTVVTPTITNSNTLTFGGLITAPAANAITTASSFNINGDFTHSSANGFTASANRITFGGASQTVSGAGAGTVSFFNV